MKGRKEGGSRNFKQEKHDEPKHRRHGDSGDVRDNQGNQCVGHRGFRVALYQVRLISKGRVII